MSHLKTDKIRAKLSLSFRIYATLIVAFLMLSLFIFSANISAQMKDEKVENKTLPPVNWNRSKTIDVKHIAIELKFDWKKKQAFGSTAITFSPFDATKEISLDAALMSINSVITKDGKILKFTYQNNDKNDNLKITLDRIYKADEDLIITIDYRTNHINKADPNNIWGSYGKGLRFLKPTTTTPNKRRQIWSSGEPESNRFWFPGYDSPNDLRTTEFTATVDKDLMVISNGELVETKDNTDGTRTFLYKADTPYPNYLTSFVVGEYVDVKQNFEEIEIHTFSYPDEKAAAEATVERLPDMVKFFTEKTGVGYPFSSYTQVVAQDYPFPGGIGQHTASTMSDNMIDDYRTHKDFLYLWDGVEAQSLASQWFGNLITPRDWSHIWLSQSFSRYLDGQFNITKNGNDEFLTYQLNNDLSLVLSDWNSGYRHPIVTRNYEDVTTFTGDNYARTRGSLVLRMLHKHLGDKKWWKAVHHYVKSNTNKQVTTEDFRIVIEDTTGESMGWFFDQWLYKMGHPIFEISKNYDDSKNELVLKVKQTQKIDLNDEYPQVEFFQGIVEIEIDNRIEQVWIKSQAENVFTVEVSSEPKLVNFDFENVWIKELKFEKPLSELLYQMQNSKDTLARRSAIIELGTIAKNEKTTAEVKAIITEKFRNMILGKPYWRLRGVAMFQLQNLLAPATETKPVKLDEATIAMLLTTINNERSWLKASAITFLGMTRDPKYDDIYIKAFKDESDRVINTAAKALGKSKSPKAFDELVKLKDKPSWKSQSLISTLDGLKELGDPRGVDVAMEALSNKTLPRWWLATPTWDYPITAVDTLIALGKTETAYPMLLERLKKSMHDDDYNDIFSNVLLITRLADPRGKEVFKLLNSKFKDDENAMNAVNNYEKLFKLALEKK